MAGGYRVLCVDDEEGLLEVSKLFLERSGDFAVTTAPGAPEGIRLLLQEKFDAIVSDYQMPVMDGIEFLTQVRKQFGQIPFILLTGKGREEIVIQALNSGADFYLQKGGDPRAQFVELAHKVRMAIDRKRADETLRAANEHLRLAQQLGRTGSWEMDFATGAIWGSEEAFRIFALERPPDGFLTIEEVEARIPEQQRVRRALTDLLEHGKDYDIEYAIRPADGSGEKIIHSVAKILNDSQNKPFRIIGIIQDITGRRNG